MDTMTSTKGSIDMQKKSDKINFVCVSVPSNVAGNSKLSTIQ